MTGTSPPLVFIYDRCATHQREPLRARMDRCRARAAGQGWELGGEFVDEGDDALLDGRRPRWWAMLREVEANRHRRSVVVLVHGWDRISRDPVASSSMRYSLARAGGHCETADGECDSLDSNTAGLIVTPPPAP